MHCQASPHADRKAGLNLKSKSYSSTPLVVLCIYLVYKRLQFVFAEKKNESSVIS